MLNTVLRGDCLELLPIITAKYDIAAIVSDPPYGGNYDTDYTRFTGGKKGSNKFRPIHGDNKEFDPAPWINFPKVILWGVNRFGNNVPPGTILVWQKNRDEALGKYLSDCEMAWLKGGYGIYLFKHTWRGFDKQSEKGQSLHPTQKPIALMKWCISRLKLPKGSIILDPYAGSGSTGVAAIELGYNFIGCEIDPEYIEIANKRIALTRMQSRIEWMEAI